MPETKTTYYAIAVSAKYPPQKAAEIALAVKHRFPDEDDPHFKEYWVSMESPEEEGKDIREIQQELRGDVLGDLWVIDAKPHDEFHLLFLKRTSEIKREIVSSHALLYEPPSDPPTLDEGLEKFEQPPFSPSFRVPLEDEETGRPEIDDQYLAYLAKTYPKHAVTVMSTFFFPWYDGDEYGFLFRLEKDGRQKFVSLWRWDFDVAEMTVQEAEKNEARYEDKASLARQAIAWMKSSE